jgi:hypothetical protein
MSDILNQLDQIGGWTGPKEWTQDPIAAAAKEEIKRLRALVESARHNAIEDCAALAQRWSDEAAEFKDSERCKIQANVCRNIAVALRNFLPRPSHSSTASPSGVMAAAANAAKVVEGWSDSKKEYADRVVGASNSSTGRQDG